MTQSLEDYLKTISILSDETGGPVRVTDIAGPAGSFQTLSVHRLEGIGGAWICGTWTLPDGNADKSGK